ncbi:EH domain-containing protein 1 [Asimina triloba]
MAHVPKFGDWDDENVPYTAFFENARKDKAPGTRMINPNDPEQNPEAFMSMPGVLNHAIRDREDPEKDLKGAKQQPKKQINGEEAAFQEDMKVPPHRFHSSDHKGSLDSRKSSSQKSRRSESSSGSSDHALMKSNRRAERSGQSRTSTEGGSSFSPPVEQARLKSGNTRADRIPQKAASVPKFGSWDETDPTSGEGFTVIFNKVKEEKQIGSSRLPTIPADASFNSSNGRKSHDSSKSRSKVSDSKDTDVYSNKHLLCGRADNFKPFIKIPLKLCRKLQPPQPNSHFNLQRRLMKKHVRLSVSKAKRSTDRRGESQIPPSKSPPAPPPRSLVLGKPVALDSKMIVSAPSCSKEHQKIYQEWFSLADLDNDGRITGNDATKFFAMSKLSRPELKQVWAIADLKRQGFLGFGEFVTAMQSLLEPLWNGQLVALAQAGHEITQDILTTADLENLNPPVMEGLDELMAPQTPLSLWSSSKSGKKMPLSSVTSIIDGLKRLYIEKLKPLEATYRFNDFVSPLLTNSDFDSKPMVMLLGQYSTGKTTFIKHLLKSDYPGAHIGPEPTTDRFVVVMSGPDHRSIPGNTIAVQADMPFTGLTTFGSAFLSKFQCSQMPHPLLEHIMFVDSPGVLSGEKQRTQRSYDFTGVTSWFAARCDLILLLFDPYKLDISDEFKRVIGSLRGHDDKIRVVLNKADQVDTQQLMRVYGALMWSLGKVLNTPEVMRVYIGEKAMSFNDKPVNEAAVGPVGKDLFEKEQDDLLADLKDIPKKACDRRINEFVKRARAAKIHAYIISHLKKEMPAMMGKAKAQQRLIDNLEDEFGKVQREFHLPAGDFPNVEHFKEVLGGYNIDKFEKLKPKMIQAVDDMLAYDIPELLKNFRNPYNYGTVIFYMVTRTTNNYLDVGCILLR